jgi:hypothetical protein
MVNVEIIVIDCKLTIDKSNMVDTVIEYDATATSTTVFDYGDMITEIEADKCPV